MWTMASAITCWWFRCRWTFSQCCDANCGDSLCLSSYASAYATWATVSLHPNYYLSPLAALFCSDPFSGVSVSLSFRCWLLVWWLFAGSTAGHFLSTKICPIELRMRKTCPYTTKQSARNKTIKSESTHVRSVWNDENSAIEMTHHYSQFLDELFACFFFQHSRTLRRLNIGVNIVALYVCACFVPSLPSKVSLCWIGLLCFRD